MSLIESSFEVVVVSIMIPTEGIEYTGITSAWPCVSKKVVPGLKVSLMKLRFIIGGRDSLAVSLRLTSSDHSAKYCWQDHKA